MANDPKNDDFPTIRLDEEDRRAYQKKQQTAGHTIKKEDSGAHTVAPKAAGNTKSSSGNGLWIMLVALVALAGLGGCYYLYTLLQQQQATAAQAESRIAQLENKLSATGEEIGESTVALQVKVTELSEKTGDLWEQMDKLWASAWRRNQQEIAALGDRVGNVQNTLTSSISTVSENVDSQKTQLASMKNELAGLADEILALNVRLEQTATDKAQQAQSVKNIEDKLSVLEQRNNSLASRISGMENELREIATKVVSSPSP